MKGYLFILFALPLLSGCQSDDQASTDHSRQKPQFGQEQSTIPWKPDLAISSPCDSWFFEEGR